MSTWFRSYGLAPVHERLVVGPYPVDAADVGFLARLGIDRILNLVEDREYRPGERERLELELLALQIEEERCSVADFGHLPGGSLDRAVGRVLSWLDDGRHVYVHCRAGWQRSAAVAAGVVAIREEVDIDEALLRVQERKPSADPLPHQREDLRRWWDGRRSRPAAGGSVSADHA